MAPDAKAIARAFERASALSARLAGEAPFPSADAAIARARSLLSAMTWAERIGVLDAHPRIGADPGTMSAASRREQGGGTDAATIRELGELNDAYERKFGFRFVVFVAGRPTSAIVPVMRARLERTRDVEIATAVEEVLAIAGDRLRTA